MDCNEKRKKKRRNEMKEFINILWEWVFMHKQIYVIREISAVLNEEEEHQKLYELREKLI